MTSDQQYLIDRTSTGSLVLTLPELVEGMFTNVEMAKETGVVGDNTSFSLQITT